MPPPPVKGVFGSTGAGIRIDRWVMTRLLELSATFLPVSSCASSQVSLEPPLCPPLPSSPPQSTHQRGGHPTLLPLGDEHPPPPPLAARHPPFCEPPTRTAAGVTPRIRRLVGAYHRHRWHRRRGWRALRATAGRAAGDIAAQRKTAGRANPARRLFVGRHDPLAAVATPPHRRRRRRRSYFAQLPYCNAWATCVEDAAVLPRQRPLPLPLTLSRRPSLRQLLRPLPLVRQLLRPLCLPQPLLLPAARYSLPALVPAAKRERA